MQNEMIYQQDSHHKLIHIGRQSMKSFDERIDDNYKDQLIQLLRYGSAGEWQVNLATDELKLDDRILKILGYPSADELGRQTFGWLEDKLHPADKNKALDCVE